MGEVRAHHGLGQQSGQRAGRRLDGQGADDRKSLHTQPHLELVLASSAMIRVPKILQQVRVSILGTKRQNDIEI